MKSVEVTKSQDQMAESREMTLTLDSISNEIAKQLANELETYSSLVQEKDSLEIRISRSLTRVKRAKLALEALQGTTFDIPELENEPKEIQEPTRVPKVSPKEAMVPVQAVPRDTSNDCPGCGSENSLYHTTVRTSRGRNINVLQCGHSGCNAQYPI